MAIIVDKKFRLCLLIAVIAVLAIGAWFWYYIQDSEVEEVLEEEIIEEKKDIEEFLKELTPTDIEPLTLEEQEEIEQLLRELTPVETEPLTEAEQKEIEELLKKLTP